MNTKKNITYHTSTEVIIDMILSSMKKKNCSNYRLHKITGIPQSSLSRYFNMETDMPLSVFLKICNSLNLLIYLSDYEEGKDLLFDSSLNLKKQ